MIVFVQHWQAGVRPSGRRGRPRGHARVAGKLCERGVVDVCSVVGMNVMKGTQAESQDIELGYIHTHTTTKLTVDGAWQPNGRKEEGR